MPHAKDNERFLLRKSIPFSGISQRIYAHLIQAQPGIRRERERERGGKHLPGSPACNKPRNMPLICHKFVVVVVKTNMPSGALSAEREGRERERENEESKGKVLLI